MERLLFFRIHQGFLSSYSSVIRDMLALPGNPSDNCDMHDGVPLVEFHEDPADMAIFLSLFYLPFDNNCLAEGDTDVAFKIFVALRLADKLLIEPLKERIIARIKQDWPAGTLHDWEQRRSKHYRRFLPRVQTVYYPDPCSVIRVARHFDTSLLTPILYYELSHRDPFAGYGTEFKGELHRGLGARWELIGQQDKECAEMGRRRLQSWLLDEMELSLCFCVKEPENSDCSGFRAREVSDMRRSLQLGSDPLNLLEHRMNPMVEYIYGTMRRPPLCDRCRIDWDEKIRDIRRNLFAKLPEFYLMPQ